MFGQPAYQEFRSVIKYQQDLSLIKIRFVNFLLKDTLYKYMGPPLRCALRIIKEIIYFD